MDAQKQTGIHASPHTIVERAVERRRISGWLRLYIVVCAVWLIGLVALAVLTWWNRPGGDLVHELVASLILWALTSLGLLAIFGAIRWVVRGFDQP